MKCFVGSLKIAQMKIGLTSSCSDIRLLKTFSDLHLLLEAWKELTWMESLRVLWCTGTSSLSMLLQAPPLHRLGRCYGFAVWL